MAGAYLLSNGELPNERAGGYYREMKKGSYLYVVLLGLDRFAAAIFFNHPDVTISALCWVVRYAPTDPIALAALAKLKINRFQAGFLLHCAAVLEWIQNGHCAQARQTDIETATNTRDLLDVR